VRVRAFAVRPFARALRVVADGVASVLVGERVLSARETDKRCWWWTADRARPTGSLGRRATPSNSPPPTMIY
jgi:hypothetical protein